MFAKIHHGAIRSRLLFQEIFLITDFNLLTSSVEIFDYFIFYFLFFVFLGNCTFYLVIQYVGIKLFIVLFCSPLYISVVMYPFESFFLVHIAKSLSILLIFFEIPGFGLTGFSLFLFHSQFLEVLL